MRILVVDDSKTNRALIKMILEDAGYNDIVICESAQSAFKFLEDPVFRVETPVDLILMDIIMPGMNGIEACNEIKKDDYYKDVPVIIVTSRTDDKDLEKAFSAGAIDYIKKPINRIELLARIHSVLTLKKEMDNRKAREQELLKVTGLLEEANRKLQVLASQDGLTGLANRRLFEEFLKQKWVEGKKNKKPLTLMIADIDRFKLYNDCYGHQAGDECLKKIACELKAVVRGSEGLPCRYGGEEFTVVLSGTSPKVGCLLAETLREKVEEMGIPHAKRADYDKVTISLGVATITPCCDSNIEELIARADKALYQAKEEGRNRVVAVTV